MPRIQSLTPLDHWENTTFRLETGERRTPPGFAPGRYLVRVHRPHRSAAEIELEFTWLRALREQAGLLVPWPLPSRGGGHVRMIDVAGDRPRAITVLHWIAGRRFVPQSIRLWQVERLGSSLGSLQQHALAWKPPRAFERRRLRPEDNPQRVLSHHRNLGPIVKRIERQYRAATRALSERRGGGEYGVIHADLHPGNAVYAAGLAHPIDFDDCGPGWLAFDFASALSGLQSRPDYALLRDAFFRGYERIRPLPLGVSRYFEAFLGIRALGLLAWASASAEDNPSFVAYVRRLVDAVQRRFGSG